MCPKCRVVRRLMQQRSMYPVVLDPILEHTLRLTHDIKEHVPRTTMQIVSNSANQSVQRATQNTGGHRIPAWLMNGADQANHSTI